MLLLLLLALLLLLLLLLCNDKLGNEDNLGDGFAQPLIINSELSWISGRFQCSLQKSKFRNFDYHRGHLGAVDHCHRPRLLCHPARHGGNRPSCTSPPTPPSVADYMFIAKKTGGKKVALHDSVTEQGDSLVITDHHCHFVQQINLNDIVITHHHCHHQTPD